MNIGSQSHHKIPAPQNIDDLTTDWLNAALGTTGDQAIMAFEVLQVIPGTATKIRVGLRRSQSALVDGPESIWIKAGFEEHSKKHKNIYSAEITFYSTLAPRLSDIVPDCLYAQNDESSGSNILIFEDLLLRKAHFFEIAGTISAKAMKKALSMIAVYHAKFWMDLALRADPFLANGGEYVRGDVLAWKFSPEFLARTVNLPRFDVVSAQMRNMDRMRDAFYAAQRRWFDEPRTLTHGDAHPGQAYMFPSGDFGLLDWQTVRFTNWAQDVANFMISGLSVDDRREWSDVLLRHYLEELRRHGVEPPPEREARDTFQLHAMHGLGWMLCPPEFQPEANVIAVTERFATAVAEYNTIDRLLS